MKRTQASLLLAFILISLCANAQDEILKTNGRSYTVNILHKDDSIVQFQKHQEPDKRIFTVPLYKIYALKYANGQAAKPDGSAISEEMYAYQKVAIFNQRHLKKGIALTTVGCIVASVGLGVMGWGIHGLKQNYPEAAQYGYMGESFAVAGGAVLTVAVLPCIIIGKKNLYQ